MVLLPAIISSLLMSTEKFGKFICFFPGTFK